MSSEIKFIRGVGFMVYEDYTSDDSEDCCEYDEYD